MLAYVIDFYYSIFSTYDRGQAHFLELLILALVMICFGHKDMERSENILVLSQSHKRRESIDTNIYKQTANGNLLFDSGNSNLGSVITQWGGNGQEVGGRFKRGYMYTYGSFMFMYDRNQTNIVKQPSIKNKY